MNFLRLICVFVGIIYLSDAKIPSYIKVCKRSDPEISECIKNSVNSIKKNLAAGIPELNVPPLEPLEIENISIKRSVQSNLTDVKIYGASALDIIDIKADPDKNRYTFAIKVPYLYITGNYELDMKVLVLNLKGTGPLYANLTDYQFTGQLKGKKMKIDGAAHLKFEPMKLHIIPGQAHLQLDNLFGGKDPELAKATNEVINDNTELFLGDITPLVEISLAQKLTEVANLIASSFTYDELFPQ